MESTSPALPAEPRIPDTATPSPDELATLRGSHEARLRDLANRYRPVEPPPASDAPFHLLIELERERAAAVAEGERLRAESERRAAELQAHIDGLTAHVAAREDELRVVTEQRDAYVTWAHQQRDALAKVASSWSWRIGSAIVGAGRRLTGRSR